MLFRSKAEKIDLLFEIVGDGPERDRLEQMAMRLQVTEMVKFLGPKSNDEIVELFNRACLFLMPCVRTANGDMDGIPVAMMEAMACEVPVVSTTISGIPELVEDGVTGRLASPMDSKALVRILSELLADTGKINQYGRAGRERVLRDFDISKNAAQLRNLIAS